MIGFIVGLDMFMLALILLVIFAMVLLLAISVLDYMLETNFEVQFKKHLSWVKSYSGKVRRFVEPVIERLDEGE